MVKITKGNRLINAQPRLMKPCGITEPQWVKLICMYTGLILSLRPANERCCYLLCNKVSHWLGTILESALCMYIRADSRFAPSQWETSLQSNGVSHWLGANLKSALYMVVLRNWPQPVLLRWMCCLVFFVRLLSSWVVCLPWFRVTMVAVELHTDWPGWRQPRCRRWHTMATWWCTDRNIADDTMKMYTVGCWYNMLLSGPICYSFSLWEKNISRNPKGPWWDICDVFNE